MIPNNFLSCRITMVIGSQYLTLSEFYVNGGDFLYSVIFFNFLCFFSNSKFLFKNIITNKRCYEQYCSKTRGSLITTVTLLIRPILLTSCPSWVSGAISLDPARGNGCNYGATEGGRSETSEVQQRKRRICV